MNCDKVFHDCGACGKSSPDLFAALTSRLFDLLQAHGLSRKLLANSTTQKAVLIKHMNYRHVSRVVANEDLFFDIGSQSRVDIALSLKADAILLHPARLGHG